MTITAGTARTPQEGVAQPPRKVVGPPGGPGPRPGSGSRPGDPGPGPRPNPRQQAVAARALLSRHFWATVPARLRLLRAATAVLTAALAVLLLVAGLAANGTWDGVADRDAPRTTSAADLNLALNDMDAQAANITAVDRG